MKKQKNNELREDQKKIKHRGGFLSFKVCASYMYLFLFFSGGRGHTHGMQKFPGQGSDPHHSRNQSYSNDNTRSLTHCATGNSCIYFFNIPKIYLPVPYWEKNASSSWRKPKLNISTMTVIFYKPPWKCRIFHICTK